MTLTQMDVQVSWGFLLLTLEMSILFQFIFSFIFKDIVGFGCTVACWKNVEFCNEHIYHYSTDETAFLLWVASLFSSIFVMNIEVMEYLK